MTVLVVAGELDRTVDGVVAALARRKVPVFRVVIWSLVGIAAVQWPVVR